MNMPPIIPKTAAAAAVSAALLALVVLPGCKKAAKPAAAPPAKASAGAAASVTNTVAGTATNALSERLSFFDWSPPPGNKGRDPFNPNSHSRDPAPPPAPKAVGPAAVAAPQLKLLSVVGSEGHRLVAINTQILGVDDEEATVRVPGGTVRVKVLAIGVDWADVTVDGTRQHLTLGQTKSGVQK
jgi:hypothetical protein